MFYYRTDEPQAKRNVIFSISNLVYELPHELPSNLRLRILGNNEILGKSQICMETVSPVSLPEIKLWQ